MSALSPGPWVVEKHAPFGWTVRAARNALGHQGVIICQLSGYEAGADARLISAAPEMLDALKLAHQYLHGNCTIRQAEEALEAAIDRAEAKP